MTSEELQRLIERKMEIERHKRRAFSTDDDGGCIQKPDDVYEDGFMDCTKLMMPFIELARRHVERAENIPLICDSTYRIAKEALENFEKELGKGLTHPLSPLTILVFFNMWGDETLLHCFTR